MSDPASTGSFAYDLPAELIAQDPPERRGDARLLLVEPGRGVAGEDVVRQLPDLLQPGDLLVFNESRVLPARLLTSRADTGGQVEILLVRPTGAPDTWRALARPQRRLREGVRLLLGPADDPAALEVVARLDHGEVEVRGTDDPGRLAERWGVMPLPPYIRRQARDHTAARGERDRRRYQTVFARRDGSGAGSVAAPTAGLHFSEGILAALADRGIGTAHVSLHVGPGTFREPTADQIAARRLHREFFRLPAAVGGLIAEARRRGGRVVAVGTTSLRVLETVARLDLPTAATERGPLRFDAADLSSGREAGPGFTGEAVRLDDGWEVSGETRLFLRPPDRITAVDGLLTNFHLPGSSLLMLVAALAGPDTWRPVYDHAVGRRLRFYSYGDAMLILPGLGEGR